MNPWIALAFTGWALFIATNIWVLLRVLRPLHRLASQANAISNGNLTAFQQPCTGTPEVHSLRRAMVGMVGHVRRAHDEGTAYRNALTDGQEAERARIAHELHDDTVQSVVAIAQSIDIATNFIDQHPEQARTMLKMARGQAVETVENLRRMIADLRPPALEELGLMPALRMLAENEKQAQIKVNIIGTERRLDESHELSLFRSTQEAIRNAQRHGQAKSITVSVDYQPDAVHLTVKDDGLGFDVPDCVDCMAAAGHYGLVGIHERAAHLNGEAHIISKRGQGTEIRVCLPVKAIPQPSETVRDPVCGAQIAPHQAYGSTHYKGTRYYFCCPVCQGAFQQNPGAYLNPTAAQ